MATFFEFLLLEIVAFFLIIRGDNYQGDVLLSSCNHVVGETYLMLASVNSYFGLRTENETLLAENALLQERVTMLEDALLRYGVGSDTVLMQGMGCDFVVARVVHASVDGMQNFLVIDKGSADGISYDMGVVDSRGVVGVVKSVSSHFATVMLLINVRARLSCRVGRGGAYCSMVWNADDYRYARLLEVHRHVPLAEGDSIYTSGLSSMFPGGIAVGVVEEYSLDEHAAEYDVKVRLASDFTRLDGVKVVRYRGKAELEEVIEKERE